MDRCVSASVCLSPACKTNIWRVWFFNSHPVITHKLFFLKNKLMCSQVCVKMASKSDQNKLPSNRKSFGISSAVWWAGRTCETLNSLIDFSRVCMWQHCCQCNRQGNILYCTRGDRPFCTANVWRQTSWIELRQKKSTKQFFRALCFPLSPPGDLFYFEKIKMI